MNTQLETIKPKGKCAKCGKALVANGSSRVNGKNHADWKTRSLHKKCWREFMADEARNAFMEEVLEREARSSTFYPRFN